MKKLFSIMVMLILLFPILAGGNSEDESIVTIWHSNSGSIGTAFDEIVDNFNETVGKEKGIEIEAIYQGAANDVLTKVKAAAAANVSSLPDIAQLDATAALDMMNSDYLVLPETLGVDTSLVME